MKRHFIAVLALLLGTTSLASMATPAKKKLAMKPATLASHASRANRIAVLRFDGPVVWDIDADEFWKIKNHKGAPSQGDLSSIPYVLQNALAENMINRLGATVVAPQELSRFQSSAAPSIGQAHQYSALAKKLGAKYVLTGTIDRLEFDGNTATPDDYIVIVSPRLVETATGRIVWSEQLRKFKSEIYTKKHGKTVMEMFASRHIPDMAESLSSDVAGSLGR